MIQKSYKVIVKQDKDKEDVYNLGICNSLWEAMEKCNRLFPNINLDGDNIDINITVNK